jgi:hypothetical protein
MPQLKDIIQFQTNTSEKITTGNVSLALQSRALIIRLPFGGFVWNRPTAVLVEENGQTKRIPIVDATRLAQVGVFALALVSVIISAVLAQTRSHQDE